MELKKEPQVGHVRHLDHLNMTVKDLRVSLRFYEELFGFETVERGALDPVPWAIIRSGEAMLCLYEFADVEEGPHYPAPPREQGVRHFALRIENGPEFYELLKARSIKVLYDGPVRWPHSTSYYIQDPSGHQIEVVDWDEGEIQFEPLLS
jgi:catechol 2,3-dioxygenase-like lactoylglutathione lyase family enzyme